MEKFDLIYKKVTAGKIEKIPKMGYDNQVSSIKIRKGTDMNNIKKQVYEANLLLPKYGLVVGTQGNVSVIDRNKGIVYIKPSGVPYEKMKLTDIVGIDINGHVIEGKLKPSVDWIHHVFLYAHIKQVQSIVHTHSPYATAFAASGIPVPCLSTGQADIFGGEIPVTDYVDNRSDSIGKEILKHKRDGCPAIILGKHGVFTFDATAEKAVFAALMTEYFAKINLFAILLGKTKGRNVEPMALSEIEKWYKRYHGGGYGQK
ncbi:MAG TPA: class II aldolase/adducin family protein [bacterium]|nr:class II aldolase/adducin family protein [bacterium]